VGIYGTLARMRFFIAPGVNLPSSTLSGHQKKKLDTGRERKRKSDEGNCMDTKSVKTIAAVIKSDSYEAGW